MYLVYYKNTCLYLKENEHFFLCISKLNRTFDCVLGTPSWICKRKNSFLSCISQNLIVPLRTEDNCEYEDKHHHSRV